MHLLFWKSHNPPRPPGSSRSPTQADRRQLGRRSEALAVGYLQSQGYRIVAHNVRFPVGELDLVALEGETLCFIEVRSTSSDRWGGALASVTHRKQRRIIRAAQWYANRLGELPEQMRFDVVAVEWPSDGGPSVQLIRGAFDAG